jgi:hypothetical protein
VNLLNHSEDVTFGNYQVFFALELDLVTGEFSKDYPIPRLYILSEFFIGAYLNYLARSWLFLAVSGMIIPLLVLLSSISSGSTNTRSSKGFICI